MQKEIAISSIKVGKRFRKDMGDIQQLADSIEANGLIVPIGVTPRNVLVHGERRLEAFKLLKRKTIVATVLESLDDELALLTAEEQENECRKAFTKSESLAISDAIQAAGKSQNGKTGAGGAGRPSVTTGDAAAKAAGLSDRHERDRVRAVVNYDYEPLIEAMDREDITPSQAANLTKLPKSEVKKIFEAAPDRSGLLSGYRERMEKKHEKDREDNVAEEMTRDINRLLGVYWGVVEKHGSVTQMLRKHPWILKKNQAALPGLFDKVSAVVSEFQKFKKELKEHLDG